MARLNTKAQKIAIIGCGNVAWHLAQHFSTVQKCELYIYNHRPSAALNEFKTFHKTKITGSLKHIISTADYYIIAVSDNHVAAVAALIQPTKPGALIMHTSGSQELAVLGHNGIARAVVYPLQTFSKHDEINWAQLPLIIEVGQESTRQKTAAFAKQLSNKVLFANYRQRLHIHLAAVLVNNFTNALYAAAFDLMTSTNKKESTMELLMPLVKQTVKKLEKMTPLQAQTGPARRSDKTVIKKHLVLLKKKNELKKLYKQLTKLIEKQQKKNAQL